MVTQKERQMPQEKLIVEFENKTPKNHSVRWDASDKDSVLSTVYIRKPAFQAARKIRVTIEEVSE